MSTSRSTALAGFTCAVLLYCVDAFAIIEHHRIVDGSKVTIDYRLYLENGDLVTASGDQPVTYEQGTGQIFPAIEDALNGLTVNDSKEVTLTAEQAFGPVDPNKFVSVPPDTVPPQARKPGTELIVTDAQGNEHLIRVREVHDDGIVLDFNHPLAGQALTFKIRVLNVM